MKTNHLLFALITYILFAQNATSENQRQLPIDRILQQKTLEQQKQKLFESPPQTNKEKKIHKQTKRTSNNCITAKTITLLNASKLSKQNKTKLTKSFLNKCIFNDDIGKLIDNITNFYISQGYINTRAYFKEYDTKTGTIFIFISEGIINSIQLNNIKSQTDKSETKAKSSNKTSKNNISSLQNITNKTQIFFAFPTSKNKIFNIRDIEQGVANMNSLRSNNVIIDSRPGQKDGTSNVIINNYQSPSPFNETLQLGINHDNSGSQATGIYNTTYSINKDNLLFINDNVGFSQTRSESSITNMFNLSFPFGYYRISYMASFNKYHSYGITGMKIEGTSENHDISLTRLMLRKKQHEINITSNLNFRNSTRKENDIVAIESQRLSTGRIGLNYKYNLANNLGIYTGITYSKGLTINAAINDKTDYKEPLKKDFPRAQFDKFSYNFNLYKNLGQYFNYNLQANAQHSADALYGAELIYIGGGEYTVRGLPYDGINGSKGGYARNDLNFNLGRLINNKLIPNNKKNKITEQITPLQTYLFYDSGFARQIVNDYDAEKTEYISGAGAGIKYSNKYISCNLAWAKNIKAPKYVKTLNNYQKKAFYFSVGGQYNF